MLQEKRVYDHWNVDVDRSLYDSWTGFTKFTQLNENSQRRYVLGRRHTKIQATTRLDFLWPEIWSGMSKAAQKKEKQQWAIEKPKLDNGRKLGGIKETIQNARKKLEIPVEAAMLCKLRTKKRPDKSRETDDETKGSNKVQKTKHACIVRLMNPRESVWNLGERVQFSYSLQFGA